MKNKVTVQHSITDNEWLVMLNADSKDFKEVKQLHCIKYKKSFFDWHSISRIDAYVKADTLRAYQNVEVYGNTDNIDRDIQTMENGIESRIFPSLNSVELRMAIDKAKGIKKEKHDAQKINWSEELLKALNDANFAVFAPEFDIYKDFYDRVSDFIIKNNPPKSPDERLDYVKARILDVQKNDSEKAKD